MFGKIAVTALVAGLCCSGTLGQVRSTYPCTSPAAEAASPPEERTVSASSEANGSFLISITSPGPGQDLSAAKEVQLTWESVLGDGTEYCVSFSDDGKVFDREIASKLVACAYTWKPDERTLVGWIKVKAFKDGYLLAESVVPVSFLPSTAVVVSKADQKVFHLSNGKLRGVYTCSTALPQYDLKPGNYRVYLKQKRHWSKKWEVWMPHSLFFHAGYAIHATTVISRLGRPASHGCIRLHPRDARRLYADVPVGTPVIVLSRTIGCGSLKAFFAPNKPQTTVAAKSR